MNVTDACFPEEHHPH